MDNGYNIWSFQGKLLQRHPISQFCQMLWRPRPQTLLSDDHVTVGLHIWRHRHNIAVVDDQINKFGLQILEN